MSEKKEPIRPTDDAAIRLAKTLIRNARYGAIATLDPETGSPIASRVGVATDIDGTPLILISLLAPHTRALIANPRCSLLVGETGKGDPLAHPRISLACHATKLDRDGEAHAQAKRRYLNRNPKAALYVELGDFSFFRLELQNSSLNGGFGKAYLLKREELLSEPSVSSALAGTEQGSIDHMNADHLDAIDLYAAHFGKTDGGGWTISGVDPEGMDLLNGDRVTRIWFPAPLSSAGDLRKVLVEMAGEARKVGAMAQTKA